MVGSGQLGERAGCEALARVSLLGRAALAPILGRAALESPLGRYAIVLAPRAATPEDDALTAAADRLVEFMRR